MTETFTARAAEHRCHNCGSPHVAGRYYGENLCISCYAQEGGTQWAGACAQRLWDAMEWYRRERGFAVDAHEMTAELESQLNHVLTPDNDADDYERAAQIIACYRRTCGHRH